MLDDTSIRTTRHFGFDVLLRTYNSRCSLGFTVRFERQSGFAWARSAGTKA